MTKITLRSYNREIEALVDQGKTDLAIAHCLHVLKYFPKHVDTYRLLGKAYLESQRLGDAADVLQRVLSAVPDDFVSHIGMSIIREDEGNLDAAIWHMQRAYDVQSSNITIQDELRRLYERRDGIEPPKIRLTRAALARMYARGDLINEAITELRAALQEEPDRTDLLVLLGKMYAVNQQRVKCIQTCSQVLTKLPYCLEANITISQALQETNRSEEAETYLARARELDPYAAFLSEQAPRIDLVPDAAVTLMKMDETEFRAASGGTLQPDWVTSLGEEIGGAGSELEGIDWLVDEEADVEPEAQAATPEPETEGELDLSEGLDLSEALGDPESEPAPTALESDIAPEEDEEDFEPELSGDMTEIALPEDRAEVDFQSSEQMDEEEIPDWMKEAGWEASEDTQPEAVQHEAEEAEFADETEAAGDATEIAGPESEETDAVPAEIPDWLQALAPSELTEDTAPNFALAEDAASDTRSGEGEITEIPEWLQDFEGQEESVAITDPAEPDADVPEWLQEFDGDTVPPTAESEEPQEEEVPEWLLEEESVSSGLSTPAEADEDVPDWLASMAPVSETSEGQSEPDLSGEDIPDWLKDLAESTEVGSTASSEDDPENRTGVTLWLQKKAGEEDAAEKPPESEAVSIEDVQEIPEPVAEDEMAAEITAEDEEPGEEALPAWLQGLDDELLAEPEAGDAAEFEDVLTGAESEAEVERVEEAVEAEFAVEPPGLEEEEMAAESAVEASDAAIDDDFSRMGDPDDALRWLESLAAKQGAREEELLTDPEERTDAPPEWVQSMAKELDQETPEAVIPGEASDEPGEELETMLEAPVEAEEESDAWMAELEAETIAPSEELEPLDWEALETDIEPVAESPEAEEVSADEWGAEHTAAEEDGDETFISQPEEAVEDVPDWAIATSAGIADETIESKEADEDLPDWLKGELEEAETADPQEEETIPDWLKDISLDEMEVEETVGEAPEEEEGAAESWEPVPDSNIEADTDIPDWLQATIITQAPQSETPEGEAEPAEPVEQTEPDLTPESGVETPDWLVETTMTQAPVPGVEEAAAETPEAMADESEYAWTGAPLEEAPAAEPPAREPARAAAPDFAEVLESARANLSGGDLGEAMVRYKKLIQKKQHLDEVIGDLSRALEHDHPVNIEVWTALGDAHARKDSLQQALDAYTKAEELLR